MTIAADNAIEPSQQKRFAWPPEHEPPASGPGNAGATTTPRRGARDDAWSQFERAFLGLAGASFTSRSAREGWLADAPDAYCARCGRSVGPHEYSAADGCPRCESRRLPWARVVRLGAYEDLLRDAVLEIKFTRWRKIGAETGCLLGVSLARALADAGMEPADAVLIPVPSPFRRRLARGIDHTLVAARGVGRSSGVSICRALTARAGPAQVDVPASRRARNVTGRFAPRRGLDLRGRCAVLVDDVMTTGSTVRSASLALRRGARPGAIWVAVLAVTES
ncbi:MAG: ComF family protein [Planctomycetes bacterium]|nr:ComF family protein [Planctomycetota bacterium]